MSGDGRQSPQQSQSWLPDVPFDISSAAQNLLAEMKARLEALYTDPTPPSQPTNVTGTAATLGNLIRWNPVTKADSYRVYRGTTNSFTASTTTLVQTLSGIANTSWYDPFQAAAASGQYYWVAAVNAGGVAGATSAMLTITSGINVNDIFAQNITATGTITGAIIQTSTANPKIKLDSTNFFQLINGAGTTVLKIDTTNGLRVFNGAAATVLQADLSGNVTLVGTVKTGTTNGRVEMDGTNGLRAYDSSGNLLTQITTNNGVVSTTEIRGLSGGGGVGGQCVLFCNENATTGILVGTILGGDAITFGVGSLATRLTITSSAITASGGAIFTGDGSLLTTLNGTNISSGTVADARIATSIARVSMGAQNLNFTSGYGIAAGGTSFAVATVAEIYTSSTLRATFGTGTQISVAGTLYTVAIESADLGTGVKNYLTVS